MMFLPRNLEIGDRVCAADCCFKRNRKGLTKMKEKDRKQGPALLPLVCSSDWCLMELGGGLDRDTKGQSKKGLI